MKATFTLENVYLDHEGYLRKEDGSQLFYGVRTKEEHDAAIALGAVSPKPSGEITVTVSIEVREGDDDGQH